MMTKLPQFFAALTRLRDQGWRVVTDNEDAGRILNRHGQSPVEAVVGTASTPYGASYLLFGRNKRRRHVVTAAPELIRLARRFKLLAELTNSQMNRNEWAQRLSVRGQICKALGLLDPFKAELRAVNLGPVPQ